MALAREKFLALLKEINKLNEKGIRIRMIGEISLLPMSVRQPAAELELKTKNNSNYILNICLAYTRNISYTSDSVPGLSLNMVLLMFMYTRMSLSYAGISIGGSTID